MKYKVGQRVHIIKKSWPSDKDSHDFFCGVIDKIDNNKYIIYLDVYPKFGKGRIFGYVPYTFMEKELKYEPLCSICIENRLLGE